jgi:hypothetical protein
VAYCERVCGFDYGYGTIGIGEFDGMWWLAMKLQIGVVDGVVLARESVLSQLQG